MKLREWNDLEAGEKKEAINVYGVGLNWAGMIESLAYIDQVIEKVYYIKHIERLPRYGMKAIAEDLRYRSTASDGSTLFKVNNNLSSDINHFLLRAFPELQGFLSCRYKS